MPLRIDTDDRAVGLYQYFSARWNETLKPELNVGYFNNTRLTLTTWGYDLKNMKRTSESDSIAMFYAHMSLYSEEYHKGNIDSPNKWHQLLSRCVGSGNRLPDSQREQLYILFRHNTNIYQVGSAWIDGFLNNWNETLKKVEISNNTWVDQELPQTRPFFSNDILVKSYHYIEGVIKDTLGIFIKAIDTIAPRPHKDPLVLDLNGDGIKTTNVSAGTQFDHDGNGFAEQTGWTDPNDGLLVLDRNGDGIINDGKELFGDQTILANGQKAANGFQALAELDENADGKIDASDAAYGQLRVWRDENSDGYSLAEELHTLEELGISSINVTAQTTNVTDEQGNTLTGLAGFEKTDGTTGLIGNLNLLRDTTFTIATEWLDLPDDIAGLPDLEAYGNVYDLSQAMVRDSSGSLKGLVEQFIAANDVSSRNSLMDQILFKWTGNDTIDPASRGGNFDGRKLAVLEKFLGRDFVSQYGANPIAQAVPCGFEERYGTFSPIL